MKVRLNGKKRELIGECNESKAYEFNDPITKVRIIRDVYDGRVPFELEFYNNKEMLIHVRHRPDILSCELAYSPQHARDAEDKWCLDARIIATHILAGWLFRRLMLLNVENIISVLEEAIHPVFTKEEALDWLEKNQFIGENSIRNLGVKTEEIPYQGKYYLRQRTGWNIWRGEPDLDYLPPNAQKVYDRYKDSWDEYKKDWLKKKRNRREDDDSEE